MRLPPPLEQNPSAQVLRRDWSQPAGYSGRRTNPVSLGIFFLRFFCSFCIFFFCFYVFLFSGWGESGAFYDVQLNCRHRDVLKPRAMYWRFGIAMEGNMEWDSRPPGLSFNCWSISRFLPLSGPQYYHVKWRVDSMHPKGLWYYLWVLQCWWL